MKLRLAVLTAALFSLCLPGTAEAHLVNTSLGDFYAGVLHPLTGFEFVLPWLALAILAAFQGPGNGRWLFLVFPVGLMVGAELSTVNSGLAFVSIVNVVAMACVGLCVALGAALPLWAFLGLSSVIAIANGYLNGQAMEIDTNHVLFVAGITAVGYAFIALTSAVMVTFLSGTGGWRPVALRAGGSWIAAVGIMVLGFQLLHVAPAG